MFMVDDVAREIDLPKYDEYADDFDINFLEQPTTCFQQNNVKSQQIIESGQPAVSIMTTMKNMQKLLNQVKELCLYVLLLFNF
jgi:hypothetical protein